MICAFSNPVQGFDDIEIHRVTYNLMYHGNSSSNDSDIRRCESVSVGVDAKRMNAILCFHKGC